MRPPTAPLSHDALKNRLATRIVLTLLLGAAFGLGFIHRSADAETAPLQVMGTWKPTTVPPGAGDDFAKTVRVYPEPATRLLYAVGADGTSNRLAAYNLDTFAPIGGDLQVGGPTISSYLTDPSTGALFLATADAQFFGTSTKVQLEQFTVSNGKLHRVALLDLTQEFPGQQVVGMYRGPNTNLLWLIVSGYQNASVTIAELDLMKLSTGAAPLDWKKLLENCPYAMHGNERAAVGIGYVARWNALYFGCGNGSELLTSTQNIRGAARLVLEGDPRKGPTSLPSDFRMFPMAGDFLKSDSFFEPGASRLLLQAYSTTTGATLYAFDSLTNSYVGGISLGRTVVVQSGVEPIKGRYYGLATEASVGLIAADTRSSPVQQGVNDSSFAKKNGRSPEILNLGIDTRTSRLFLKYIGATDFLIVKDNIPPYIAASPVDPDAATSDLPEEVGKTEVTYSGNGQGYGARYRHIGGIEAAVVNATGFQATLPIGSGTREVRLASVDRLTVGNGESTALGITAIADEGNTQGDLQKSQLRRPDTNDPITEQPIAGWPYHQVRCVDLGGNALSDEQPTEHAKVTCDAGKSKTLAEVANGGASAAGLDVGRSSVSGSTRRDPSLGQVTEMVSIAEGVSVLDVLSVGRVETKATAVAKGRRGTAKGSFNRTVSDIRLNGELLCSGPCTDLHAVAETVNSQLLGRVRIEFPEPETVSGSPRGYQTVIQRSKIEQIEQIMLNEQPADHLEVPGMVVYVYQDGAKPGRVIGEFAAVEAEARYGVNPVDSSASDITGGGLLDTQGIASLVGTSNAPVFGLTPPEAFTTKPPRVLGANDPGGVVGRTGKLIWNGLGRLLRLLPVWALLLAPIYLSARRWLLLQRSTITPGGSA
jgi:hypothetical protein